MTPDPLPLAPQPSARKKWWVALKLALFAAVTVAVAQQAWKLWSDIEVGTISISYGWLILAAPVSVLGWLPSAVYWRESIGALGEWVRWRDACRAYYAGHLAKYIPGKALTIVVRAGMLKNRGASPAASGLCVIYETLVTMNAGVCIGLMLIPWVIPVAQAAQWRLPIPESNFYRALLALGILVFNVAGLGPMSKTLLRIVIPRLKKKDGADAVVDDAKSRSENAPADKNVCPPTTHRSPITPTTGFMWLIAGWWAHGLSLGMTIHAVIGTPFAWEQWPLWTAAAALGMVGGFLAVFAPGGLVVREGLLFEILAPHIGEPHALLVAVLYRVVGLAGEILAAGGLYYIPRDGGNDETQGGMDKMQNQQCKS